jgi:hypothetical protein
MYILYLGWQKGRNRTVGAGRAKKAEEGGEEFDDGKRRLVGEE